MTQEHDTNAHRPKSPQAADWALSHGQSSFTTAELASLLGTKPPQVAQRLASAVRRGEWVKPAKGLWIAVPPEYRTWGAPPAIEFVDAMMRFIGADYYIGWLSAAALHGSAHHAPQITQIATSRPVRDRVVGRNRLNFNTRSNIINLPTCEKTVRSGAVRISTPEVTAMDLCSDLVLGAGIDNVATVIEGLAAEGVLSVKNILSIAQFYSPAVLRRLGWILENFTNIPDIDLLAKAAASLSASPSVLDYLRKREGTIDSRWSLLVNAGVESEY